MKKIETSFYISRLIIRDIVGSITAEEKVVLSSWLEEEEANRSLYQEIRMQLVEEMPEDKIVVDTATDWKSFVAKRKKPFRLYRILRYAAVAMLLMTLGSGIFYLLEQRDENPVVVAEVTPGTNRARLILANGRQVNLDGHDSIRQIGENEGVRVIDRAGEISYEKTASQKNGAIAYHTLQIPRGGEYSLVLSDGTKVWLNAKTELKYPLSFTGKQRIVELSGEAYFEVTPDAAHPFIVRTATADVKVYGTSFNVCAYPEDACLYTTLETGSVSIDRHGKSYLLEPGQQAVAASTEEGVQIRKVNVNTYCSWRNGSFVFEEERLESILTRLSRWYDVDIFYQNESLKELHFTGDLGRYKDFEEVLSFLEMTMKARFIVKGRTITVSVKK